MTYETFLEELRKTPRDWKMDRTGGLWGRKSGCAWSAVTWQKDDDVWRGSQRVTYAIWDANDNLPDHDPIIRRDLLAAMGLEELA